MGKAIETAIKVFLVLTIGAISILGGGCSMSGEQESLAAYPQQMIFGSESTPQVYLQKPGYYAVHYAPPPTDRARITQIDTTEAVAVMEEESIAVFSGTPADRNLPAAAAISPVYALQPNGSFAVPTGRVFVRFAETVSVESCQAAIQAAGYEIGEHLPYAPHAAWLQARSGNIADALDNISQLMILPDVENVEPQMLMQRSLR